jgi:spore coat protein CotH
VDGKVYPDVGVHFHGMSSFMVVEGSKRSLTISTDFIHDKQELGGYRKLDLLNSHDDPSFLRSLLGLQVARDYIPAPKANLMRVVINGESWGIYVNQQHFNKDFLADNFSTTKGARWKVKGSPGGRGGLNYLGDDAEEYKRIYDIKSKDEAKTWAELIRLCKALSEESPEKLEKTLPAMLDVEGALKFFAWDNVLANGDGFWARASDYSLYRDQAGRFHIIPYDANETFSMGGRRGGPGGPGGSGGAGGPGRRGGFGPGMFLAPQILDQADKNADGKLSKGEFTGLADVWFDR